jgi:hypothetical protein
MAHHGGRFPQAGPAACTRAATAERVHEEADCESLKLHLGFTDD